MFDVTNPFSEKEINYHIQTLKNRIRELEKRNDKLVKQVRMEQGESSLLRRNLYSLKYR